MALGRSLKTNLSTMAQLVASAGRRGDTMLAHITPQEAEMLRASGGAGTVNPDTGLPEFFDGGKTTFFGGPGESVRETYYQSDAPMLDYSNVNVGVSPVRGLGTVFTPELEAYMSRGFGPSQVEAPSFPSSVEAAAPAPFSTVGVPQGQFITAPEAMPSSFAPPMPDISGGGPAKPQEPGAGQKILDRLNQLDDFLKSNPMLARAIGAGLPALTGALLSRRAQRQAEDVERRLGQLGGPQREAGAQLLAQSQAGQLTAPQQQRLQEFAAQQRQGLASRGITGGTAAQQLEATIERERQRLLSENLNQALQLLNIGDAATANAIRAGLSASQEASRAGAGFYASALQTLGAMPTPQQVVMTPTQRAPAPIVERSQPAV